METKHTPGPWKIYDAGRDDNLFIEADNKGGVCKLARKGPDKRDRDLERANANLIAAAPELLEQLHQSNLILHGMQLTTRYNLRDADRDEFEKQEKLNEAAIRKAKGE